MYKLIIYFSCLFCFQSCAETGSYNIDLSQNQTFLTLKPTRYLTTWNQFELSGKIDCKIKVILPSETILLTPGVVRYSKRHEWFDNGATIEIIHENCGSSSSLIVHYAYTASYW